MFRAVQPALYLHATFAWLKNLVRACRCTLRFRFCLEKPKPPKSAIYKCCPANGTVPTRKDPAFKNREAFISELAQLVSALHRRGVVHLDLKHRSNVVTTVDGHPVILDFASGLCFNPNWFGGRLAVKLFGAADRLAVVKWKRRLCPELLSEAEQRRLSRVRRFEVWLPNSLIKGVLRLLRRET